MDKAMMMAESLLRDIYEAESSLRWFEYTYGLLAKTFCHIFQQGKLHDEDPNEIQEYLEFSGSYEIYQDRCQRYEQAVEQRLQNLSAPASLHDLHMNPLEIVD